MRFFCNVSIRSYSLVHASSMLNNLNYWWTNEVIFKLNICEGFPDKMFLCEPSMVIAVIEAYPGCENSWMEEEVGKSMPGVIHLILENEWKKRVGKVVCEKYFGFSLFSLHFHLLISILGWGWRNDGLKTVRIVTIMLRLKLCINLL